MKLYMSKTRATVLVVGGLTLAVTADAMFMQDWPFAMRALASAGIGAFWGAMVALVLGIEEEG